METYFEFNNNRKLPTYLGYGVLDEKSVKLENDVIIADYVFECDGTLVHHVEWSKDRCKLDTYCHGKSGRKSSYPDLEKVLMCDCMSWTMNKDDPFLVMSKEVCNSGNIFVNHPKTDYKNPGACYFPAGKLFIFTLPLIAKTSEYEKFLSDITGLKHISFFRERKGYLLKTNCDFEAELQTLTLAQFIVPLAYLVRAAKTFTAAGIISKEKVMRMMVHECFEEEQLFFQTFIGDKIHPFFGVCFREFAEDKLQALKDMFLVNAARLNKSLMPLAETKIDEKDEEDDEVATIMRNLNRRKGH